MEEPSIKPEEKPKRVKKEPEDDEGDATNDKVNMRMQNGVLRNGEQAEGADGNVEDAADGEEAIENSDEVGTTSAADADAKAE